MAARPVFGNLFDDHNIMVLTVVIIGEKFPLFIT
jgi:hypothetical protein